MHQRHAKMHAYMLLRTHGDRHTFEERQTHKHALNTDQKPKLPLNSQRMWPTEKTGRKEKKNERGERQKWRNVDLHS